MDMEVYQLIGISELIELSPPYPSRPYLCGREQATGQAPKQQTKKIGKQHIFQTSLTG